MDRMDCPVCGGLLFYLTKDKAYCIDDDCGWRTPECLCNSCRLSTCRVMSIIQGRIDRLQEYSDEDPVKRMLISLQDEVRGNK